jgi:hypothetical protein
MAGARLPGQVAASRQPASTLIRNPRDAEAAACTWMQEHGFADARLTARGADGGVDVVAVAAVAQVKAEVVPAGAPVVQQLAGIAAARRVAGLVFALAGFTQAARRFAAEAGIALFTFDLQSQVEPVNDTARAMAARDTTFALEERLAALAASVGVTGVPEVNAGRPQVGLRAWPFRLASWAGQVAAGTVALAAHAPDGPYDYREGPSFTVDLAGCGFDVTRLYVCGSQMGGVGSLTVWVSGQALTLTGPIHGLEESSSGSFSLDLPVTEGDRFARAAVGLAVELTSRVGASPVDLRVVSPYHDPNTDGRPLEALVWHPRPHLLVEHADPLPLAWLTGRLTNRTDHPITLTAASRVRDVSIEATSDATDATLRLIAQQLWAWRTPGPDAVAAAVAHHLPDVHVEQPTPPFPLYPPWPADPVDSEIVRVTCPVGDVPAVVAVLSEALTISASAWA